MLSQKILGIYKEAVKGFLGKKQQLTSLGYAEQMGT